MGTRLDSAQQAIAGQQSGVDDAKSAATHAEVLAIIALIVGLLAGAAGFFAGRRVRGGTSRPS